MSQPRILVVEDDVPIRRGVVDALQAAGYTTCEAGSAIQARRAIIEEPFDLLLLDLVLPGGDGLDILEELRGARPERPVIILTARGEEADRVRGLRLGADDYVVKPFSARELLARVEAVLRRAPPSNGQAERVEFAGGAVDLARNEILFDDATRAELSQREAVLLAYFARNAGRTIDRDELIRRVWNLDPHGLQTRTVDMHVARLREKLGDDPAAPRLIRTIRGKGYVFAGVES
ncbi:MAG: response regulator transcription factor [Planctomycetales bacterium]